MEIEMQMTSMTLDFSSGSFPLCKLLENCFEIICWQGLRYRGRKYVLVAIRMGSFPFEWALLDAALFPFLWLHALAKPSDLPIVPSPGRGWHFCARWCLCAFVSSRTLVRSQLCSLESCFEKGGKRN